MDKLTWTNTVVSLGELVPWEHNPKRISKNAAKRLLQSFEDFGQVQTVAIGPQGEVYDGHQRLSALLAVHGASYQLDARRSNRPLTEQERKRLVVTLHAGAVGEWDWEALAGWDAGELSGWGFDAETLNTWNDDAANLATMLEGEKPIPEFKEYDETSAGDVRMTTCPECGKTFPI